eukprot:CAMPEP_0119224246 /NCGR_PEP_ID=MMETSP1327-20130426/33566_1 /TAXON_ID=38833 /ORGANISM="Micromonas pusilla, Strain RCC2306" /LENGTH=1378 /DNA_ID=CAMNT_0007222523 /DNA_START=208 /DNA_END=4348 /DNA_ORIENTATION=+
MSSDDVLESPLHGTLGTMSFLRNRVGQSNANQLKLGAHIEGIVSDDISNRSIQPPDDLSFLQKPFSVELNGKLNNMKLKLIVMFLSSAALFQVSTGFALNGTSKRVPHANAAQPLAVLAIQIMALLAALKRNNQSQRTDKLQSPSMRKVQLRVGVLPKLFNGNYLPSSGSAGSGGSLSCADRPIIYGNRRCYEGSERVCKDIDGNGVCVCGANYRVQSNECVPCPTGYANGAGDNPSGSDTDCDVCAENFYVSAANTCTACPGTSTRPAGDDNSAGVVTTCSCTLITPSANVDISGSSCADGLLDVGETCTGYSCISDAYDPSGLEGSIICGDDGLVLNTATCSACSQNHYVSGLGTCTPCPGDSTRPKGDDNSAGETTSCSCGAFSPALNLYITSSTCSSGAVDVGHTCTGLACPDGYLLEGSISCDNDGIISNTANCNKCDEDYYVSASGTCSRCPGSATNQAGDDNTAESSTRCDCAVSPSDSRVILTDSSCADGKVQTGSACAALSCQPGYELSGSLSCSAIDQGAEIIDTAACATCSTNYYVSAPGVCSQCPPSTTNLAGDDNRQSATKCDCAFTPWARIDVSESNCAGNTVETGAGCSGLACQPGYALTGMISCDQSGLVSNNAICTRCAENHYVSSEATCVACPGSSIRAEGDPISVPNTACACPVHPERLVDISASTCSVGNFPLGSTCDNLKCPPGYEFDGVISCDDDGVILNSARCNQVICGLNEKVEDHACAACPPGEINFAGDDASGDSTECDAEFCGQDEYVDGAGACIPCSTGYINEAGDDPTQEGTVCNLCAADYFVSSVNTCEKCPGETTRASGDENISGDITKCACTITASTGMQLECTGSLEIGSKCSPTCTEGYTVVGEYVCEDEGTLAAATCSANPCNASAPPTNGGGGGCTSSLASGSSCSPTCNAGYSLSGSRSCSAGTLTDTAVCGPNPCIVSADSTKNGTDGSFYCINGGTVGGVTGLCNCTSCDAGYGGKSCQTAGACSSSEDPSKHGSDGTFYCINGGDIAGTTGTCMCTTCNSGYGGASCQILGACSASTNSSKDGSDGAFYCINGGTIGGTTEDCACTSCDAGYGGKSCQTAGACSSSEDPSKHGSDGTFYCINGGDIAGTTGTCMCTTCNSGYGGASCQILGACSASTNSSKDGSDGAFYCINGGTIGGTTEDCACTSCDAGYGGKSCQTAGACSSSEDPSKHGSDGTFYCINGGDIAGTTGTCMCTTCNSGYGGASCQILGACSASTNSSKDGSDGAFYCINGGTIGGTTEDCACTSCNAGYEGTSCQTAGTCTATVDSSKDGSDGVFYCINGGTIGGTKGHAFAHRAAQDMKERAARLRALAPPPQSPAKTAATGSSTASTAALLAA